MASFNLPPNSTSAQNLSGSDTGTVAPGASLAVASGPAITLALATAGTGISITDAGTISAASGRAIDTSGSTTAARNVSLTVLEGGLVTASNDGFRINADLPGGTVLVDNAGTIRSTGTGRAVDFNALVSNTAEVALANHASGVITAAGNDAIRLGGGGTTTISNAGTIDATGGVYRAINVSEYTNVASLTVINAAGATIQSEDDAVRINSAGTLGSGTVLVDNAGIIRTEGAGSGQAIDFNNVNATAGSVTIVNEASGLITAADADAVRPGQNGTVNNHGTIYAGAVLTAAPDITTQPSNDGVDFQDGHTGTVHNYAGGLISGARAGVIGGEDSTVFVINDAGATIIGRDGAGAGSDGDGTIVNYGTITGMHDAAYLRGDGDGIDISQTATITNFGTIEALGAAGYDGRGRANVSDGLAIGGGTVENHGTISSVGNAVTVNNDSNTDGSRSGNAALDLTNEAGAVIEGIGGYAIRSENKGANPDDDVVVNHGTIIGNGTIPDPDATVLMRDPTTGNLVADPYTVGTVDGVTYTSADAGSARFILGDGSAIQLGEGNDTLSNYGVITGNSGRAINLEGGDDTLNLYTGSVITGRIDGGTGGDTLNLDAGASHGIGTLGNVIDFETLHVLGGTWTLLDAQGYANGVSVAAGAALSLGTAGTLSGAVAVDGLLAASHADTLVLGDAITGQGMVEQFGGGTLVLAGANSFSGGLLLHAGTVELASAGAAGTGAIQFTDGAQTLVIDQAALAGGTLGNTLHGLGDGDTIDLRGIGLATGISLDADHGLSLTTPNGTTTALHLDPAQDLAGTVFLTTADGHGGTAITVGHLPEADASLAGADDVLSALLGTGATAQGTGLTLIGADASEISFVVHQFSGVSTAGGLAADASFHYEVTGSQGTAAGDASLHLVLGSGAAGGPTLSGSFDLMTSVADLGKAEAAFASFASLLGLSSSAPLTASAVPGHPDQVAYTLDTGSAHFAELLTLDAHGGVAIHADYALLG